MCVPAATDLTLFSKFRLYAVYVAITLAVLGALFVGLLAIVWPVLIVLLVIHG